MKTVTATEIDAAAREKKRIQFSHFTAAEPHSATRGSSGRAAAAAAAAAALLSDVTFDRPKEIRKNK